MPANLTPEYKDAEARFRDATTPEEKLACLQEMLRVIPKHKGTEKMQADLKRRISKLQTADRKKTARRPPGEFVEHEGPKQVLLVGGPNAGKSSLIKTLTGADPEVAPYPYTTTRLAPGMMPFEDIQIQLVDSPAICREFVRPWMSNQLRACDLVIWTVSLGNDDLLTAAEELREILREWHVILRPVGAPGGSDSPGESGEPERSRAPGQPGASGGTPSPHGAAPPHRTAPQQEAPLPGEAHPAGAGAGHAASAGHASTGGPSATAGPEPASGSTADGGDLVVRPALLVATHADDPEADVRLELLLESLEIGWRPLRASVETGEGLEALRRSIFENLHIVRVYTKVPGKKADHDSPFVLDAGSTVMDLANAVHHDIATGLKFARIWGKGAFDGQHVQRDHVLADGDVVELHA